MEMDKDAHASENALSESNNKEAVAVVVHSTSAATAAAGIWRTAPTSPATTNDSDSFEPDSESCTLTISDTDANYFEPPYTATLAPFNDDLLPKKRKKSKLFKKLKSKIDLESDSNKLFIKSEQELLSINNSTSDMLQQQSVDDAADTTTTEKCKYLINNNDNSTNKIAADSEYNNDSTTSTLLLQDNNDEDAVIDEQEHCSNEASIDCSEGIHTVTVVHKQANGTNSTGAIFKTTLAPMTNDGHSNIELELADAFCKNEFNQSHKINYSLYFEDGQRTIDFVLAFKANPQPQVEEENIKKRRVFEENLISQGLEIEHAYKQKEQIHFVKIHAPLEVLRRYSEILKLRMPMKELYCRVRLLEKSNRLHNAAKYLSKKIPGMDMVNRSTRTIFFSLKCVVSFFLHYILEDERYFPKLEHRLTAIYSRDKEYLFDVNHECFFTTAIRSRIVQFILDRQRFPTKTEDEMAFGIERLVEENVYAAAYPLHDGIITEKGTMRHTLYKHWASVSKWYRFQPLDYVKEYFGVKIGLYFAWLGYYTYMLLLASIVGVVCFVYSWVSLQHYEPVKDICLRQANVTMCPLCDWCNFWDLHETCVYAKITYLIDNPSTVFFAVFMSFWAALFLELWKRYSAEITHRWDLTGFDVYEEHPRPQYLARLKNIKSTRTDYVTSRKEPTVPFWRMKLPATVLSVSVVLMLIALAFVALVAVVVYRMSTLATLKAGYTMTTSTAIVVASASAAFINLCLLYVLNYMYNELAEYLTELEMWRTQTQFDDSLTLKIYLLQFVNYYASIFYIAFVKGKFVGHPGQYNTVFDYRQEECSSGGCLTELCIQLAIIMIGKQAFNTILEVIMPMFWRKVIAVKVGLSRLFSKSVHNPNKEKDERWVRDFKLLEWGPRSLFPEYLEMVLQYGFVTIFVAAFPLAPFFALLNNILEMRLDAKKLLTHHRRPVSQRVRDIGVWYRILDCIGKLSIITNGFIIAFTSDMIPRWVYRAYYSGDGSLDGYLDFTLSVFNISDSNKLRSLAGDNSNITMCKYADFREPPTAVNKYKLSNIFYIILACRLAFVVVFENFVALVMIIVRWCIPDMTAELRDQIKREVYITNEIIIDQEARRARRERLKRSSSMRLNENAEESVEQFIKIDKLLNADLSQSQLDLFIHGESSETGIAGTNC